jgi:hypothetical protein
MSAGVLKTFSLDACPPPKLGKHTINEKLEAFRGGMCCPEVSQRSVSRATKSDNRSPSLQMKKPPVAIGRLFVPNDKPALPQELPDAHLESQHGRPCDLRDLFDTGEKEGMAGQNSLNRLQTPAFDQASFRAPNLAKHRIRGLALGQEPIKAQRKASKVSEWTPSTKTPLVAKAIQASHKRTTSVPDGSSGILTNNGMPKVTELGAAQPTLVPSEKLGKAGEYFLSPILSAI